MKQFGVEANIVALSGIAIAIGTMVDVGIVLTENVLNHVRAGQSARERFEGVYRGATEVAGAVSTAVLTTVVSFLPVFTMEGAEGKLFKPLAYTKTYALLASIVVALVIIPPAAHVLLGRGNARERRRRPYAAALLLMLGGVLAALAVRWWVGLPLVVLGLWRLGEERVPERLRAGLLKSTSLLVAVLVGLLLARLWEPLGPGRGLGNVVFTVGLLGGVLLAFQLLLACYEPLLRWCLRHKPLFLLAPCALVLVGLVVWLGFAKVASPLAFPLAATANAGRAVLPSAWVGQGEVRADDVRRWKPWSSAAHAFPGLGKEFMPSLDEGSFLLMPVTMAHASIGEAFRAPAAAGHADSSHPRGGGRRREDRTGRQPPRSGSHLDGGDRHHVQVRVQGRLGRAAPAVRLRHGVRRLPRSTSATSSYPTTTGAPSASGATTSTRPLTSGRRSRPPRRFPA